MAQISTYPQKLKLLVFPSGLSGLIAIFTGLLFAGSIMAATSFKGSDYQLLLLQTKGSESETSVSTGYRQANDQLAANSFVDNLPLLIFWGCVGLIVYFFTMNIVNALSNLNQFKSELNYVHANRRQLIMIAFQHLVFRIFVAITWALFIRLTLLVIIPYSSAAAHVAGSFNSLGDSILYGFTALLLVVAAMHIHTLFLRLLFMRPRLFGQ